ncbi:AraC family transcriptional regulator [Undibacterium sp. YM2]|uniref:helix-turn-helix domain-containing protein n=1 Tax=Undibacterium sp. YM2 TaxID=2058625 RepID=UPI001331F76E|nr:helix-turn-helix transcriptional regulator [Undibacterium sp. YM2]BBB68000.1 AraC family transcriptional regulator [Undibacterium sp. YM2]
MSSKTAPDYSDWLNGPDLIALRTEGEAEADSQFLLGTREYDWHSHARGQVFCVESGLIYVRTRHGSWLLPPHRAGWIPPEQAHSVRISGAMSGWSVLLTAAASAALPAQPCVVAVNDLMRALVVRAATWSVLEELGREQKAVMAVLLDELRQAPHEALHLPMPASLRLRELTAMILAQPGVSLSLPELARVACMSGRTLSRHFQQETGMSIGQWCQQAQLLHALERLAAGDAVATVADALGYATPSNFIAMFKRYFGQSPGKYFSQV